MSVPEEQVAKPEDQVANLEQSLEALEALVERLESGELPLAKALEEFERGVQLTRRCQAALKAAEQRVEILLKGDAAPTPFEDVGDSE